MKRVAGFRNKVITTISLFVVLFLHNINDICYADDLKLNDRDYFEMQGFNVLAFENGYTGMFFDEKTAGIILIHHGVRTATGGAVRLKPAPEHGIRSQRWLKEQ